MKKTSKLHYGWILCFASCLMLTGGAGIIINSANQFLGFWGFSRTILVLHILYFHYLYDCKSFYRKDIYQVSPKESYHFRWFTDGAVLAGAVCGK